MPDIQRRELLVQGSAALAAIAALYTSRRAYAFPTRASEEVIRWLDQPTENPDPVGIQKQLVWEDLDSWITPNDKFFSISHFNRPTIDEKTWSIEIGGLVKKPLKLTLADIKARPRQEVVFTVECSGNHGFPFFTGGIGNARWAGTPLAPILEEAGVLEDGIEVVFFGTDTGEVAIRDVKMQQNFARSMSLAEATNPDNLLCYEMNGAALPAANGFPLRLIAPGWYGIANVKWLERIEVRDTRFMSLLMARDYVTIREEERNGETVWTEDSVGRALIKSAPAKVTRKDSDYRIIGAALGGTDRSGRSANRSSAMGTGDHRPQRGGRTRLEDLVPGLAKSVAWRTHGDFARGQHHGTGSTGNGRSLDCQETHILGKQWPGDAPRACRLIDFAGR